MEEKFKKQLCLMPETHNRLNQAFVLFQGIKDNYHDELLFTSNLNNIIQALRNVTFVMQKELAHTEGFENWYKKKQDEMREDKYLRWSVKARNHVVKEGDLKKFSYTKVRLKNHFDTELFGDRLDHKISLGHIADWFRQKVKIPKEIKDYAIIEAERIWIIEDFPESEVIDIIIYCFGLLTNLVYLAHEEVLGINSLACEKNTYVSADEDYMVKLHNTIAEGRINQISYSSGAIMTRSSLRITLAEDSFNEVYKRYSKLEAILELSKVEAGDLPFNKIPYHIETAKHFLEVDGSIMPTVFLYFTDKPPIIQALGFSRPTDRYLIAEDIAKKITETQCAAVVLVTETWHGKMPKNGEKYIPASVQKAGESISVFASSPKRLDRYSVEILRDKNNKSIIGEENHSKNMNPDNVPFFNRIYDVWADVEWAK